MCTLLKYILNRDKRKNSNILRSIGNNCWKVLNQNFNDYCFKVALFPTGGQKDRRVRTFKYIKNAYFYFIVWRVFFEAFYRKHIFGITCVCQNYSDSSWVKHNEMNSVTIFLLYLLNNLQKQNFFISTRKEK